METTKLPKENRLKNGLVDWKIFVSETYGVTTVTVKMDSTEEYLDFFKTAWPKALDTLKSIVEK